MRRKHRATDRGKGSYDRNALNEALKPPVQLSKEFHDDMARREEIWRKDLALIIKEHDDQLARRQQHSR